MSSHHIVREDQEPALLIDDAALFDLEAFGPVLEWSPTIIAEQACAGVFEAWELKLDLMFIKDNAGSVSGPPQEHIRQIQYSTDFLKEALAYLVLNRYKAVNILTSTVDQATYEPFLDQINIVLLCGRKRFMFVKPGFVKWLPAAEHIEIRSDDPSLQVEGATRIKDKVYRQEANGFVTIRFRESKYIMVAENVL